MVPPCDERYAGTGERGAEEALSPLKQLAGQARETQIAGDPCQKYPPNNIRRGSFQK